jgi:hypothetical protein
MAPAKIDRKINKVLLGVVLISQSQDANLDIYELFSP